MNATLQIHICDQRRSYQATFANEADAVAFIERKSSTHAFLEVSVPEEWQDLLGALYPTCTHGMSLSSCYGPDHFMDAAQEAAMGWDYSDAPAGF